MNTEYKGIKISEDTKFENMDFVQYDFSMSDLSEVVFENVNFSNCAFNKTVCKSNVAIYRCRILVLLTGRNIITQKKMKKGAWYLTKE